MKLKYIFGVLLSIVLFAGCASDDEVVGTLDSIQFDQTILLIPTSGGSATLTVKASGDWVIEKSIKEKEIKNADGTKTTIYTELPNNPAWLTADKLSGTAGETKITFSAGSTEGGRECTLRFGIGDNKQFLIIRQGSLEASNATGKEVMTGPDGKNYRVTGVVTKIANTHYGNWYLDDGTFDDLRTGSNADGIYVYGTADKEGKFANDPIDGADGWKFEVGDVVTIEGPKTTYGGSTVELVNVTVIKVVKSLIKIVPETATTTVSKEGGDFEVKVAYKGSGAFFKIPDAFKSWISYKSVDYVPGVKTIFDQNPADTAVYKFTAAPNTASARVATIDFTSSSYDQDKQQTNTSSITFTVNQEGSVADVTIADFLAAEVGDAQYRLNGIITSVAKATYGNVYIADYSGQVYVYGIGAKGDFEKLGLKAGDIVTLLGKRGEHNGSAQMTGGQYESSISVNEVTIDEFLTKEDATNVYYKVTGIVDEVANPTYGNLYLKSGDTRLYVYGCYPGWGATGDARKNCLATKDITVGDELTVIGVKSTRNGAPQVSNGIYFSHKKAN